MTVLQVGGAGAGSWSGNLRVAGSSPDLGSKMEGSGANLNDR